MKINKITSKNISLLKNYLKNIKILSNFTTYQQLYAFTHLKELYIVEYKSDTYLFILEKFDSKYIVLRWLFQNNSINKNFKKELIAYFKPDYFVVNISTNPKLLEKTYPTIRLEYFAIVSDMSVDNLLNKIIINKYKKTLSSDKGIGYLIFDEYKNLGVYVDKINSFLYKWMKQTGKNPINDIFFWNNISIIKDFNTILYFDDEEVIGLGVYVKHPSIDKCIVSIFNKNLRGYKNLGYLLEINKMTNIYRKYGHDYILMIGGHGTDNQFNFKKQFLKPGDNSKTYSYELINNIDFNKYEGKKTRDALLIKVWC